MLIGTLFLKTPVSHQSSNEVFDPRNSNNRIVTFTILMNIPFIILIEIAKNSPRAVLPAHRQKLMCQ